MTRPIVIIEVSGGVAEYTVGSNPDGVDVKIIDHDNPSVEHYIKPSDKVLSPAECKNYVKGFEDTFYTEEDD